MIRAHITFQSQPYKFRPNTSVSDVRNVDVAGIFSGAPLKSEDGSLHYVIGFVLGTGDPRVLAIEEKDLKHGGELFFDVKPDATLYGIPDNAQNTEFEKHYDLARRLNRRGEALLIWQT